jgi:hypothetical protein
MRAGRTAATADKSTYRRCQKLTDGMTMFLVSCHDKIAVISRIMWCVLERNATSQTVILDLNNRAPIEITLLMFEMQILR